MLSVVFWGDGDWSTFDTILSSERFRLAEGKYVNLGKGKNAAFKISSIHKKCWTDAGVEPQSLTQPSRMTLSLYIVFFKLEYEINYFSFKKKEAPLIKNKDIHLSVLT